MSNLIAQNKKALAKRLKKYDYSIVTDEWKRVHAPEGVLNWVERFIYG